MKKWISLAAIWMSSAIVIYAQDNSANSAPTGQAASPAASPSASAAPATSSAFKDDKEKVSYSIGVDIGRTLQRLQLDLNQGTLTQGITDVLSNKPIAMSDQELQATLQAFQKQLMEKQQAAMSKKQQEMKTVAEKNKADGKKFLDENSKKEGVKTTASGLQYRVIKEGTGEKPKDSDFVETDYRGTTIDGKEFDSSAKNGGPVSFPVNGVIKGWSEALKLMPVGSKWQLFIPSDLAYGDEGAGEDIAPGSTLVFDVELLNIKKDNGKSGAATDQGAGAATQTKSADKKAGDAKASSKPSASTSKPQ
jgi:FKBP-type peptidyl-prolyl cis-trans isomerase FklB